MPTDVLSYPLLRDVDWRGSALLNVVLQTSFSLTVSTCRRVALAPLAALPHWFSSRTKLTAARGASSRLRLCAAVVMSCPADCDLRMTDDHGSRLVITRSEAADAYDPLAVAA